MWGRSVFLVLSHTPHPKGTGPQRLQIFWDLRHARTQHEKQQPNFAQLSNWMTVDRAPCRVEKIWSHEC